VRKIATLVKTTPIGATEAGVPPGSGAITSIQVLRAMIQASTANVATTQVAIAPRGCIGLSAAAPAANFGAMADRC
jgi:hypothetical protein